MNRLTRLCIPAALVLLALSGAACDSDDAVPGSADAATDAQDVASDDVDDDAPGPADATPDSPDAPGPAAREVPGCNGALLLENPADPTARGPWAVGARTATVAGTDLDPELTLEVWYPAPPGSDAGQEPEVYDIRVHLPEAEQGKIPDEANPAQVCACHRDLPLDTAHGPYPAVLFIHGTAGFRTQSLTHMTHWASRGFIVLSADHPGMKLANVLSFQDFGNRMPAQAAALLTALRATDGDLAFLDGHVDLDRLAASGHSAGGNAVRGLGAEPGVRVLMPMAAGGADAGASLRSTLVLGALDDQIVEWPGTTAAFESTPAPKRLVGLANAGHLAFSDLCALGREQGGILQIASDWDIAVLDFIVELGKDGCGPDQLAPERGWDIIHHASSAVLEDVLHCSPSAASAMDALTTTFPEVSVFEDVPAASP